MRIQWDSSSGTQLVSLAGEWKYKKALKMADIPPRPLAPNQRQHVPTVIYNGQIAPLTDFTIKGVIWYQGESNASMAANYRKLFPAMIRHWRKAWNQGDFPFLFVQLANFGKRETEPVDNDWAQLREAQFMTLSVPKTGMAVIIDIGEANDIHPKNKQDVGHRLALAARAVAYGEDIVYSGPVYRNDSMKIDGNKARLEFDHVGSGLMVKGDALKGFAIAGKDGKYAWADAAIEGNTVVVWSDKVMHPKSVRYAWGANPECNLYNKEGLPASPFRTHDNDTKSED
jgi:sialate O-acetylesterase